MVLDKERSKRIVELFFKNNESITLTKRCYEAENRDSNEKIALMTVRRIIEKWRETGTVVHDRARSGRPMKGRSILNIKKIQRKLDDSPKRSARRMSRETGIPYGTVWRILREDLNRFPYKVQLKQTLTQKNKMQRLEFATEVSRRIEKPRNKLKVLTLIRWISFSGVI